MQVQTSLKGAETKLALLEAQLANIQVPSGITPDDSGAAEHVEAAKASDDEQLQAQPAVEASVAASADVSGTTASELDLQGRAAGEPPDMGTGAEEQSGNDCKEDLQQEGQQSDQRQ